MRKIMCQSCKSRRDGARWEVFGSVVICESCRLAVINWFYESEFNFGHPFVAEFMDVNRS